MLNPSDTNGEPYPIVSKETLYTRTLDILSRNGGRGRKERGVQVFFFQFPVLLNLNTNFQNDYIFWDIAAVMTLQVFRELDSVLFNGFFFPKY